MTYAEIYSMMQRIERGEFDMRATLEVLRHMHAAISARTEGKRNEEWSEDETNALAR